jgi:hypothetical protein
LAREAARLAAAMREKERRLTELQEAERNKASVCGGGEGGFRVDG